MTWLFMLTKAWGYASVPEEDTIANCPFVPLRVTQLPRLTIPRTGHHTVCLGNEILVAGGHKSGFVLTDTAELFDGREWRKMPTAYNHDFGLFLRMKSGKILFAGGCSQDLGIGLIFSAERYHPDNHTFEGFGCLDYKRCFAESIEMDSGQVIITGNWYHDDAVERFDGKKFFSFEKKVTQNRARPYIFRTSNDNLMIFSAIDEHGNPHDQIIIDQLHGLPSQAEIFKKWKPMPTLLDHPAQDSFVGDEKKGEYKYLFPVIQGDDGDHIRQIEIAITDGTDISLLSTNRLIPLTCEYGDITYFASVIADRKSGRAYLMGRGNDARLYVARFEYPPVFKGERAKVTLFVTEPLTDVGMTTPVLTSDGNILLAGGHNNDNFAPKGGAVILHVRSDKDALCITDSQEGYEQLSFKWWIIAIAGFLLLAGAVFFARKRKTSRPVNAECSQEEVSSDSLERASKAVKSQDPKSQESEDELMKRICQLIENERLYLRTRLKVSDVAAALETNSTYVTDCINSKRGCSFSQFINEYRVNHAKQLMVDNPEMKMVTVCTESGFSNETSFFRTFKQVAGYTPREWLQLRNG